MPHYAAETVGPLPVERVYERLARAADISNPPKLVVQTWKAGNIGRVAFLRTIPGTLPRREIVIDDKTIEICGRMKEKADACIAFFLAHELAHFKHDDNWGDHFGKRQLGANVSPDLSLKFEMQADRFGCLFAGLAGFDSLAVAPLALDAVYREYNIAPDLPGYLSLDERKKEPEQAKEFLSKLLPMFDAASLLMSLGSYVEAATLYDAILEQFPSRELHNNAGVALASVFRPSVPWLLDGSTRLPPGKTYRGEADLLVAATRAREHFEQAIVLDRTYWAPHRNLGLLLRELGEEPDRALAELKTADRLAGVSLDQVSFRAEMNDSQHGAEASDAMLQQSARLPGGKLPSGFFPAGGASPVTLAGGLTFLSRVVNGFAVFSTGPLGTDRKKLYGVRLAVLPEEWNGRLGPGRQVAMFPSGGVLYERTSVFASPRGVIVFELR